MDRLADSYIGHLENFARFLTGLLNSWKVIVLDCQGLSTVSLLWSQSLTETKSAALV